MKAILLCEKRVNKRLGFSKLRYNKIRYKAEIKEMKDFLEVKKPDLVDLNGLHLTSFHKNPF